VRRASRRIHDLSLTIGSKGHSASLRAPEPRRYAKTGKHMNPDQIYENLRKRIAGEHGYISSRIGWLLTSQGIFLALLKLDTVGGSSGVNDFIQHYLPVLAMLVSLFTSVNVFAAISTINALVIEEKKLFNAERSQGRLWPDYLETKRPQWIHPVSMTLTVIVPVLTFVFWLALVRA